MSTNPNVTGQVSTNSNFTLDASNALTGRISILSLSASDVTVAMGSGSGHLTIGSWWLGSGIHADGNVTIDYIEL